MSRRHRKKNKFKQKLRQKCKAYTPSYTPFVYDRTPVEVIRDPLKPAIQTRYGQVFYIKNFIELGGTPDPDAFKKKDTIAPILETFYSELVKAKADNISLEAYEILLKEKIIRLRHDINV